MIIGKLKVNLLMSKCSISMVKLPIKFWKEMTSNDKAKIMKDQTTL